jgi:hypothetical protein
LLRLSPFLLLLSEYLLLPSLLINALLLSSLSGRHSILLLLLLPEYLLRGLLAKDLLRLRLLPLLPTATAVASTVAIPTAASRWRAALLFLLSRRAAAVRISSSMTLTLSKNVLIQA